MARATLLILLAALALGPAEGCGTDRPHRGDHEGIEEQAGAADEAEPDGGPDLIGGALDQVQLPPTGNGAALVADAEQVPGILLELARDPCLATPAFEDVIDQIYMAEFGRDVDFIIFVVDPSVHALAPFGIPDEDVTHYRGLRYVDRGIGTDDVLDKSVGPANLRGYAVLGQREHLVNGVALHELGHAWAAYLTGPPALADQVVPPDADLSDCRGDRRLHHWNNARVNGMMGGWSDLAGVCDDSEYTPAVGYRIPFAPLEMYLMGLAEPEEVPPVEIYPDGFYIMYRFFEDPEDEVNGGYSEMVCIDETGQQVSQEEFEAQIITVTIDDIVEHNGPRIPTAADSPKHFHIALLVLAAETLDDQDWDFYQRAMDFLAAPEERSVGDSFPADLYPDFHAALVAQEEEPEFGSYPFRNFYMATGGRATIEFVELLTETTEKHQGARLSSGR
jgi:hypothetical protein